MPSRNYHFQLMHLLKRFNETLILTTEQIDKSHEFLFEDRKYLPFQGQLELHDILSYLKDNMMINHLRTLNDVIRFYTAEDNEFGDFLDELTTPKPSNVWIGNSDAACNQQITFPNAEKLRICVSGSCIPNKEFAFLPNIPFVVMPHQSGDGLDNSTMNGEQINRQGEAENCFC